jgi:DNA polymerase-3 subunit delta'
VNLIGQDDIVRELRSLAQSPEPPHALLFAGPEGTGRAALALTYAKLLNCEGPGAKAQDSAPMFELPADDSPSGPSTPCGVCRPCRLIDEGTHPDVIRLGPGDTLCRPRDGESHAKHPDSRDIRICQVRGLIDAVSRYPFEARYRTIIIDPADRLAREASNTILKTLEEPPGHTILALISAAPDAIIETILSRCRRIDVRTVPRPVIEAALVARGTEPAIAARAAEASRGRPGRALAFAASPDLMGDRARLLDRCAKVAAARTTERFRYAADLAERFRRDRAQVGAELDIWEAFWEERLRASVADRQASLGALEALRAVGRARENLQTQVIARAAFELMLLSFPRVTLVIAPQEETPAHA